MAKRAKKHIKITPVVVFNINMVGNVKINGKEPEPHERRTINFLANLGYDVETIIPSNTPGSRNPDILMMGTFWEMKGPITPNKRKIIKRFRKAIKQAEGKSVFDLRNMRKEADRILAKKIIMELFVEISDMRRVIIIEDDDSGLDIMK